MPAPPAAVEASSTSLGRIHRRLHRFIGELPRSSGALLAEALLPAGLSSSPPSVHCRNDFFWLLIPEWIAGSTSRELDDILWAQYCLYCLLRLQDDVVDGDARNSHLVVAGNLVATEASRSLGRHFAVDDPVWRWYLRAIETSSAALIEIDERQRRPQRRGERDLALYAELSRCLTVATRAVVALEDGEWERWRPLLDHLAIAAQVLDDFHDLHDDLEAGVHNFAAWVLTRPIFAASLEANEAIVAAHLATAGRIGELFAPIEHHLDAAVALLDVDADPRIGAYLRRLRRKADGVRHTLEERRRRLFVTSPHPSIAEASSYTAASLQEASVRSGSGDPSVG